MNSHIYTSPIGNLYIESNGHAITKLSFLHDQVLDTNGKDTFIQRVSDWLDAYFKGNDMPIPVPLEPSGTPFQLEVWKILQSIPFGEISTYGDIAKRIAKDRGISKMSAQAVGQAIGKNPIGILIPCHRVIGTNKHLVGFGGGLDIKRKLLENEGHLSDFMD